MKKLFKSILSAVLVISMFLCATVSAFAADGEEYICELRLIYAEDYEEAKEILEDGEFKNYKLLKENLNAGTDEIGVWLAYKTTTNIEDAITDIAVMQMNGGYTEGNYQEMIDESYGDYVDMGVTYKAAIEYFIEAYDAGDYLAEVAFRQLNLYNVISEGIPEEEIPSFEGERIGDIFYDGIDEYELATMFMQGNSYVLNNIRALLALGVSYNPDGKAYFEKVGEAVEEMKKDPTVYEYEDYDDLAALIALSINVFSDMFKELATVEDELDYEDDNYTDLEIKYVEYMSIAERMREVNYLGDKTLYQFCLDYTLDEDDYSSLYPLVAALNEGQIALTYVAHYYDVVRYSVSSYTEEVIEEKLSETEEKYGNSPFNIYEGVDRTIYYGTFALTSDASRADAYTEESKLADAYFGSGNVGSTIVSISSGIVGACIFYGAFKYYAGQTAKAVKKVSEFASSVSAQTTNVVQPVATQMTKTVFLGGEPGRYSYEYVVNDIISRYFSNANPPVDFTKFSFSEKVDYLNVNFTKDIYLNAGDVDKIATASGDWDAFSQVSDGVAKAKDAVPPAAPKTSQVQAQVATASASTGAKLLAGALYIVGGAMMLYSAYSLIATVYNYYHPDYEDIPIAMVDLVETVDGDRYIKYDVVFEAETNDDGVYEAADLNAFEAQRWNALYYTKSYEAGKPLLADTFAVSTKNNKPRDNYAPVHGFGELICYNLNRYNFDYDTNIYLSVKQSKNDKAAVAGVPEMVGSVIGSGLLFLSGGVGFLIGVGGTLAVTGIIKKKRSKNER